MQYLFFKQALAKEDYATCGAILQKTVIDKFRDKNQEFIEILIKNNIKAAISTTSSVEEAEYQALLPEEIREHIVKTIKPAKEEDEAHPANSDFDSREKAFMERLTKVRARIERLYEDNTIEKDKLAKMQVLFIELTNHPDLRTSLDDESISIAKKAYSFIQGLSSNEMTFLIDIGVILHSQVLEGISQREAQQFFDRLSGRRFSHTPLTSDFWNYSIEQVRRILDDYANINSFDFDSVSLSEGYVHKGIDGLLLAVSVCGEADRIYVWNLDLGSRTPVAALGGLYETVYNLKILRDKGCTFIVAKGLGRMYVWDLSLKKSQPTRIFENATRATTKFTVVRSTNGNLYVLGITQYDIYIWDFYKVGGPVKHIKNKSDIGDIFIFNSRLAPSGNSYALIGDSSTSGDVNNMIWEIKEESALNFTVIPLFDEEAIIGIRLDTFGPDYRINRYKILQDSKVLGALTEYALILYDVDSGKQIGYIPQEGQHPFKFDMIETNGQIYVLIEYLWIAAKDDRKGLVRCFSVRNGVATEIVHLFQSQHDMGEGVITVHGGKIKIFFNENRQGTIFTTEYNQKDFHEFYKFPDTMRIVDMTCG